jgi:chromate transporter
VPPRIPLSTVLREWGRIGLIGFGGPPAHVALLRDLVVERRGWLTAREFEDANAACQLLPGPASTQLCIYAARRVAGTAGALAGGLAFILPGLVLTVAIAAVALQDDPPQWVTDLGAGAAAAVVAVVAQAGLQLGRAALQDHRGARLARAIAYLLAGAMATVLVGAFVVLVLLACGLIELAWQRRHRVAVHAWPPLLALAATTAAAELPAVAWTALKVGLLSYGGGFVIIPLMQEDAVTQGWMTAQQFANAVAYGQITPGPVTHTVALVGWAAAGPAGALVASVVAFAPSFAFVMLGGDRFEAFRSRPGPRAFLDGAGPAAVGAILGASLLLAGTIEEAWQWAVLAAAALGLAVGVSAFPVLLGGAAAGVLISTIP